MESQKGPIAVKTSPLQTFVPDNLGVPLTAARRAFTSSRETWENSTKRVKLTTETRALGGLAEVSFGSFSSNAPRKRHTQLVNTFRLLHKAWHWLCVFG